MNKPAAHWKGNTLNKQLHSSSFFSFIELKRSMKTLKHCSSWLGVSFPAWGTLLAGNCWCQAKAEVDAFHTCLPGMNWWSGRLSTHWWAIHITLGVQPDPRSSRELTWGHSTGYLSCQDAVHQQEGLTHSAFFPLELCNDCTWKKEMASSLLPHHSTGSTPCPAVEAHPALKSNRPLK